MYIYMYVYIYVCICIYTCIYIYIYMRKTLRGVFLLGRVKSGETLGNGCSSTKSFIRFLKRGTCRETWMKIFPNSQFLLNTISLTERSNRQPGSTA